MQHPATLLTHDEPTDPNRPVVPPVYQTSLFTFPSYDALEAATHGRTTQPIYTRGLNPTAHEIETRIAQLERAEAARATASGMAAITTAVLSQLNAGDHVICVQNAYPDAYKLFTRLLPRFNITIQYVDGRDTAAVIDALPGARLAYLESPTSLTFHLQDLNAIAAAAREHHVTTIIDNTWATPILQQPITHGIDIVVHSASKYLSGHSDVVAGIIAGPKTTIDHINALEYPVLGGKIAPWDAALILRGLRTLPLRLQHQGENALRLARWLHDHPAVKTVHHPALATGDQQRIYQQYFKGPSSLFSIELHGDKSHVRAFIDALELFQLGVSWGGHESLAYPAAIGRDAPTTPNPFHEFNVPETLVRLHIGLEHPEDLQRDLEQALHAARKGPA